MNPIELNPVTMNWADWMELNNVLRIWSVKVKKQLRTSARRFKKGKKSMGFSSLKTGKTEYKLAPTIKHRLLLKQGIAEGTGFRFQRHGVFRHYGTGRGYKRIGGQVVRVTKNPDGSYVRRPDLPFRRTPEDWLNPIINSNTPDLANKVVNVYADAAVNATRLRIV